jgi:hypothetical protein
MDIDSIQDAHSFFRFFEVPGMSHCAGGKGGHPFTVFDALVAWVENGTAPDTLPIAFTDSAGKTNNRILCPYPKRAAYNATCGDSTAARCFACEGEQESIWVPGPGDEIIDDLAGWDDEPGEGGGDYEDGGGGGGGGGEGGAGGGVDGGVKPMGSAWDN